jgi:hypothetical protein
MGGINMRSKSSRKQQIEKELENIRVQISQLANKNTDLKEILQEKAKADETGSNLFTLLKYLMDENKKTTMVLKELSDKVGRIDSNFNDAENFVQEDPDQVLQENKLAKYQPIHISGLDAKIMQIIQMRGLTTADDLKKQMNYKGRNAASARINKLYKQGLLERYQLGHKVYYKYDAGKTTNTLIVSPPQ